MPTIPAKTPTSVNSVDAMNAIRSNASDYYKSMIPIANSSIKSVQAIGQIITTYTPLQNEFLSALVNRIGRVLITSKTFFNPWAPFKKGMMEFGETLEEIYVDIAKPFQYDPALSQTNIFKREIPDVKAAFHTMNYQLYYKATVSNDQLRQAFLSWQGISDLVARIVDAMYTGANNDEFLTMKYLLARHILDGNLYPITIANATAENAKAVVTTIKAQSNKIEFPSRNYNPAGVQNYTVKDDQFIILNSAFDAVMDVNVLASAFNMDKAQFMGHRVLVDSFGSLDIPRLTEIFAGDTSFVPPTPAELASLDEIPAVLLDRDWFMVIDNFYNFTEQYNGEGLYWNYWYHTWKTFSMSPFSNATLFVPGTPTVTSVSVTPATASVSKGQTAQFKANVVTTHFAPSTVVWSTNSELSSVDANGKLTIGANETATTVILTATSTYDNTKKGTAAITVPTVI